MAGESRLHGKGKSYTNLTHTTLGADLVVLFCCCLHVCVPSEDEVMARSPAAMLNYANGAARSTPLHLAVASGKAKLCQD